MNNTLKSTLFGFLGGVAAVAMLGSAGNNAVNKTSNDPAPEESDLHVKSLTAEMISVHGSGGTMVLASDATDGSVFTISDSKFRARLRIGTTNEGAPYVNILDANSNPRIFLGLLAGGEPLITFSDNKGRRRMAAVVAGDGEPDIQLSDGKGVDRVVLGAHRVILGANTIIYPRADAPVSRHPSLISSYGEDGKILFQEPVGPPY